MKKEKIIITIAGYKIGKVEYIECDNCGGLFNRKRVIECNKSNGYYSIKSDKDLYFYCRNCFNKSKKRIS